GQRKRAVRARLPGARLIRGRGCPLAAESWRRPSLLPSQLGLDWHSCWRGQYHEKPVFIVSGARQKLIAALGSTGFNRPSCTGARSPANLIGDRRARTPTSSVIVFGGVPQWSFSTGPFAALECATAAARFGIPEMHELRPFRFCPPLRFGLS